MKNQYFAIRLGILLLIGLFAIFFVGKFRANKSTENLQVVSRMMEPALPYGSVQLVESDDNIQYKIAHGDIIVYRFAHSKKANEISTLNFGRVIALEGDTIRMENSELYLNGQKIDEPYANYGSVKIAKIPERLIPPKSVFIVVDKRTTIPPVHKIIPLMDVVGLVIKCIKNCN